MIERGARGKEAVQEKKARDRHDPSDDREESRNDAEQQSLWGAM